MQRGVFAWVERHQVPLYLAGLIVGSGFGLLAPTAASQSEIAISPLLGLLIYSTFLGVPFAAIGTEVRDGRFLVTALVLNFAVVPVIVFALSRFVAHDQVLLVGVLFVLLTPCIDYVLVFTGLVGGAQARLLAAVPLLMLLQMVLLPVYLRLFVGPEIVAAVAFDPFIEAFLLLIVLPLAAAVVTQLASARSLLMVCWGQAVQNAMVPLMVLTLAVVVASQISDVSDQWKALLIVVPLFVLFAAVMVPWGMFASRIAKLDAPGERAMVFSGVTRNSLVVLPLVLALPAGFDLAPLIVVTQTLVELIVMVFLVRTLPRLVPHRREC